jgi:hypothetical protein
MRRSHQAGSHLNRCCFQLGIRCDPTRQSLDRCGEIVESLLQLGRWLDVESVIALDVFSVWCGGLGSRLLGPGGGSSCQAREQNEKKSKAFHDY